MTSRSAMTSVLTALVTLALGCGSGSEAADESKPATAGSAIQKGSAGGFSATLSADLAKSGSGSGSDAKGSDDKGSDAKGSDAKAGDAKGSDAKGSDSKAAAGSDAKGSAADAKGSDSKIAMAGSDAKGSDAKSGTGKPGTDVKPDAGSNTKSGTDAKAGSAAPPDPKAGSNAIPVVVPHPPPVSTPAELAAIKLNMEPNWDRDVGEAGTISLTVKGTTKPFVFRYSMDDPKSPPDRDAYKKWLADQHLLTVSLDRQRGAAWYLEGTNGDGVPAFRYLVNYGGKHLICGGLLYKDPESNKLGDIRDRVIIQAKQICESMSL